MPNNMVLLETIALTQSAASVTFDNLPTSGYTDLKIVYSARTTAAARDDFFKVQLNGSSSNFSARVLYGSGSGAASFSDTSGYVGAIDAANATANTFNNGEFYLPNYRSTVAKSFSVDTVQEDNQAQAFITMTAGLWNPGTQAAITSIAFVPNSGSFVANSTFSLYGIAAYGTTPVTAPKATGGNIVANDGTYWYHAFTSSGYFVPQVGLTCDVLVVAGGGGANASGGGAGAGGAKIFSPQSLANGTNYIVTIGAGGIGSTGTSATSGVTSIFGSLSTSGGGLGGGFGAVGGNGGSGGGAGRGTTVVAGGTGISGEGQNGGTGGSTVSGAFAAGGGGGQSVAGGNNNSSTKAAGSGGTGIILTAWANATNTGDSGYYAGGGGGAFFPSNGETVGAAGLGGGTAGSSGTASNSPANTGGGAGGGITAGGNGGSGIVIVRYPIN